ncbi:MAG: molybdopterin synthase sulfur carrier subunit [Epsilonproteobacteria bacterium]|nr:MAG: molybdopterin synthase sulfur carrier subunit [Campylobacterota bacterium]
MIRVEFLGPIGKKPLEIDAATLREVSDLLQQNEALADWLPKCAVALNDMMINDLDTPLKAGDKITILPPVCGG